MFSTRFPRLVATPALLFGLLSPALMAASCDTEDVCDANLTAKLVALNTAVDALVLVSGEVKQDTAVACANIATALGATGVPDTTDAKGLPDEEVKSACQLATTALQNEIDAGLVIDVVVEGGRCVVDSDVQFDCEGRCDINGQCDLGDVEVRCQPGELSVQCGGTCQANAVCQGTAMVEANCTGTCQGLCKGSCEGTATAAEGEECAGSCEGTCTGDCKIAADVDIDCGANVRCKGGCDGTATAPQCEAALTEPSCSDIEAECQAGCDGQATFEADCTKPTVKVNISGGSGNVVDPQLLIDNLPALLNVVTRGELIATTAGDVADPLASASNAVGGSLLCAALSSANIAAQSAASLRASASISVSVTASASVTTTAGAGN